MTQAATSITGLISGIDTASIVQQLMSIERRPLDLLQEQIDKANAQKTAFTNINTNLLALKTVMDELSKSDLWNSKSTTVSDSDVVSAAASTNTPVGTYTFTVSQLATAGQVASGGYADSDTTAVGAGSFDITVGSTTKTITVSATDTLADVAADINGQGLDLTAVVVNTGQGATPYKLVMTSRQTGEDNAVTVSANTSGLTFSDLTVARNSVINFGATNPIQIESATNTVTSLAPGLTLELKDTSAAPISVVVSGDTSGVTAKAQDFVTKYNAVMSMISKYSRYDTENSKAAELFGNSTLRYLQQDLALAISTVVDSQPAETNSLTMVGFSLDSGGTLSLDEATFAEALADNADGVTGLFSAVTNRALASNGGGISGPAGEPGFDVNDLIDGSADSEDFGAGDGFMTSALPASFTVTFDRARDISQLILRTINSAAMPSADFGVSDFSFELQSSGGAWSTVKSVAGFTGAASLFSLDRPQSAVAMRVTVSGTNAADGMVRLLELSANEEEGVAHKVSNVLDQVTRYGDGQIATEQTSLDEKISSMEKQIEDMQARLDAKETRLRAEFTAMESAMAKMQTQSQQFLAQINGSSSS